MTHGKRYNALAERIDPRGAYSVPEAARLIKEVATAGFDETIEVAVRLGVDPRHAEQMVRGTVVLPHGTGKRPRILVFAQGEKAREAEEAGADHVGAEDLVERIKQGWLEFEAAIATPVMMPVVGRLGRILGPRGLMPNPKAGTVTEDVGQAVRDLAGGKIEFRVDKTGNIHAPVGKASFTQEALAANIRAFLGAILRAKPASAKGTYLRAIAVSPTMGPSVKIDPNEARWTVGR